MKTNTYKDIKLEGAEIAIVRSRFNDVVTGRMLEGCLKTLEAAGIQRDAIHVVEVPGAFEIPLAADLLAGKGFDAVITLGCVMRGQTPHDRYISNAVIPKLTDISLQNQVPVILGIITPLDQAQADARSTGEGNKGVESAHAAIEMIEIMRNSL